MPAEPELELELELELEVELELEPELGAEAQPTKTSKADTLNAVRRTPERVVIPIPLTAFFLSRNHIVEP